MFRSSLAAGTPARRGGPNPRLAGPPGEREGHEAVWPLARPGRPGRGRMFFGPYFRQAWAIMSAALSACAAATKSAFPSSLSRDAHEER